MSPATMWLTVHSALRLSHYASLSCDHESLTMWTACLFAALGTYLISGLLA